MLHIILLILNIVSLVVLSMLIFGCPERLPCDYSEDTIVMINDVAKDLSIAVITSTFFYYLVFFLIEQRRNKKIREINQGKLQLLFDLMQYIVAYYVWKLNIQNKDETMMSIPCEELRKATDPVRDTIERLRVCQPSNSNSVGRFDGNTELNWLNHYTSYCERFAKQLIDSPVFCMDDIILVQIVKDIASSSLISDIGMAHANKLPLHQSSYSEHLIRFYELFVRMGKYVSPKTITLNENIQITSEIPIIFN